MSKIPVLHVSSNIQRDTSNQPVFFKVLVNGTGQSYFYELADKYPWNFHVRKKLQGHRIFTGDISSLRETGYYRALSKLARVRFIFIAACTSNIWKIIQDFN